MVSPNEWRFPAWSYVARVVTLRSSHGIAGPRSAVLGDDKVIGFSKGTLTERAELIPGSASDQLCKWTHHFASADLSFLSKDLHQKVSNGFPDVMKTETKPKQTEKQKTKRASS